MTERKLRRNSASITGSRWVAYATAGAATALVGVYSAEGEIHYSGPLNITVNAAPGSLAQTYIQLVGQAVGNSLNPFHSRTSSSGGVYGVGGFIMYGVVSGAFGGAAVGANQYASRLNFGQGINSRPFLSGTGLLGVYSGFPNSNWDAPGEGYVAFRFDSGAGMQYGWMHINVEGTPGNSLTILDYAYGDFGDMIAAGQIPEPGSLGLLALGGLGLVAWRRRRSKALMQQS